VRELIALALPPGQRFVDRLRSAWDDGDAVLPVDVRLPGPARDRLLATLQPTLFVDEAGEEHRLSGTPVEDGDALVMATSGSTGAPKGVVHTHASVAASARATSTALAVDVARDAWVCCLPLAHVAGLSVVTRAWWAGVPVEVIPAFDAEVLQEAARTRGATLTTVVPTALQRIDAGLFRTIVVGGSAPPSELPPNCVVSYGMTETGSAVTYDGRPLDEVELRVVDGEIWVRGPMLLRTYREGRDGRDPKTADGWFPTGDAGTLDATGRLSVHGRSGDLIITGGENVWPSAVEAVLERHPAVAEVAVVGRADPEWGHRVVALVVPADAATPPSLEVLREHVKAELHPFAAPREVIITDTLPRTALGKIARHVLR
jgi:o-succinylbenzoate---CoA ligase